MTYTITSYGGGEVLHYVFQGIASILGSGGFLNNMVRLSAVLGISWTLVIMAVRNSPEAGVKWFLWFLIATNALFLPKATLWIKDPLAVKQYKIDNVPFALAAFSGAVSQIGQALTEKIEQSFTLPDYLPYHETGTVFASKLMGQVHQMKIVDADFNANMTRFVNQCVVYDVMIGYKYTLKDLQNSKDVWALVKSKASPLLGFSYKEPGAGKVSEIVTCKVGAEKLETLWRSQLTAAARRYGARFFPGSQRRAGTELLSKLPQVYSLLTEMSESAEKILQQEMMLNVITDASNNKLSELGGASNYAATKALLQQRTAYQLSGEIAGKILPVMKNVFEAIAYGAFVFIFILALLPNGYAALGTYMGLIVWIQMWPPLYAILNLIMTVAARSQSKSEIGQEGLTMITSLGLADVNTDMAALAGWLSLSIPGLAYMITKGGAAAFVNLAGHLGGALQSAASSTAHEVSSGNFSIGNVSQGTSSFANASAFQHNTSVSHRSGQIESVADDGSVKIMQADGSQIRRGGEGVNISQGARRIMMNDNFGAQASEQMAYENSIVQGKSRETAEAMSSAARQTADLIQRLSKGRGSGEGYSLDTSTSSGKSIQNMRDFSENLQKSLGLNEQQAAEVAASVTVGAGVGMGILKAGIDGKSSFSSSAQKQKSIQEAQVIAKREGYTESLDSVARSVKDMKFSENQSQEVSLAKGISASVEKIGSAREAMSVAQQKSDRYSKIASMSEASTFNVDHNATQDFLDYVASQPVNHGPNVQPGRIGTEAAYKMLNEGGSEFESHLRDFKDARWRAFKNKIDNDPLKTDAGLRNAYEQSAADMRSPVNEGGIENITKQAASQGLTEDRLINSHVRDTVQSNQTQAAQTIAAQDRKLREDEAVLKHATSTRMEENAAGLAITNAGKAIGSAAESGLDSLVSSLNKLPTKK